MRARLCLCLWHSGGECVWLPDQAMCSCNGSRHEAPTDGASFAAALPCEAERDFSRCVLVSVSSGTRMESACRRDHASALIALWHGAAM